MTRAIDNLTSQKLAAERDFLKAERDRVFAEQRRLEAEQTKLQTEESELRRPFYKRPEFYVSVSPAILTIGGLIAGYFLNWFGLQNARVEAQRILVEAQTKVLEADTKVLGTEKTKLQSDKDALGRDVAKFEIDLRAVKARAIARCWASCDSWGVAT